MSDNDFSPVRLASAPAAPPSAAPGPPSSSGPGAWQNGDTTSFRDLLDIVNPLQHIPIVSTIYRAITGDQIGFMPRVIGAALFGGPIGFAVGLASGLFKIETGKDPGEMVMAGLFGGDSRSPSPDEPLIAATPALPANQAAVTAQAPADPRPAPVPGGLPMTFQPALSTRFRSTDLPQPVVDGGAVTHVAGDLVPTAAGQAITRDEVPVAMTRALDKYAAMMRARNATGTPSQVSLLR